MTTKRRTPQRWPRLEPLPCPFCGKAPTVYPLTPKHEGNAWGAVRCINKKCAAQPRANDGSLQSDERGTGAYQDAAIRRWNRRR